MKADPASLYRSLPIRGVEFLGDDLIIEIGIGIEIEDQTRRIESEPDPEKVSWVSKA